MVKRRKRKTSGVSIYFGGIKNFKKGFRSYDYDKRSPPLLTLEDLKKEAEESREGVVKYW